MQTNMHAELEHDNHVYRRAEVTKWQHKNMADVNKCPYPTMAKIIAKATLYYTEIWQQCKQVCLGRHMGALGHDKCTDGLARASTQQACQQAYLNCQVVALGHHKLTNKDD